MTAITILVTGAFGQIGRCGTQILLERGRTVIATDLRSEHTVAAGLGRLGPSARRGRYADPWALIEKKYGADALANADGLARREKD